MQNHQSPVSLTEESDWLDAGQTYEYFGAKAYAVLFVAFLGTALVVHASNSETRDLLRESSVAAVSLAGLVTCVCNLRSLPGWYAALGALLLSRWTQGLHSPVLHAAALTVGYFTFLFSFYRRLSVLNLLKAFAFCSLLIGYAVFVAREEDWRPAISLAAFQPIALLVSNALLRLLSPLHRRVTGSGLGTSAPSDPIESGENTNSKH